jgi:hypothetical protein
LGNGIDWKVGVFDSPLGYEVFDAGSNPNYTRSYGYAVEPTEFTGVLGTYKINDELSISAGIANTLMAGINQRAYDYSYQYQYSSGNYGPVRGNHDWNKTYMGALTFTAPASWGWIGGSSLYAGIVGGFDGGSNYGDTGYYANGEQVNYYAGITLNTPWKALTTGVAFDYVHNLGGGGTDFDETWYNDDLVLGLYATYKATDKLSFNGRAEYIHGQFYQHDYGFNHSSEAVELTGTIEYDLWANVVSRLEIRWDHASSFSTPYAINDSENINNKSAVGFYANVIYKF